MSEKKLQMDQRIDVEEILQDLDQYRPRRRGRYLSKSLRISSTSIL